ncbi:LL-diaminopimelate aminotransferase [Thalassocella blandensis]|nr:LL-diaminopimelate aminotransferase [Thalassocella blandensis]
MNPNLERLQPYPFEKLNRLKSAVTAPSQLSHIALSIGEPKHEPPQFVMDVLAKSLDRVSNYPSTIGLPELREAIANWAEQRFKLSANTLSANTHVLPVNGTREAIFALIQALFNPSSSAQNILMPNPFYQIYEGATLIAGGKPVFLNCLEGNNFLPDFDQVDEQTWKDCQLLLLCTPGNPSGTVMSCENLKTLILLADKYDFVIASDECYSELYQDENSPPPGLLQACAELGRDDYNRCIVFHSLSKRSNLPGLRSGFVAGDANIMQKFLQYRTYHGCAMPVQHQMASIAAWQDETHVIQNRQYYREKYAAVTEILKPALNVTAPPASFYLWAATPIADTDFTQQLFAQQNVTVLPGSYLARETANGNPGANRIRMALVASLDECVDAAKRIRHFCESL